MATTVPWGPCARFLNLVYQGFGDRYDLYKIPAPPGHWLLGERAWLWGLRSPAAAGRATQAGDKPGCIARPTDKCIARQLQSARKSANKHARGTGKQQ